jgi:hypothetical protein
MNRPATLSKEDLLTLNALRAQYELVEARAEAYKTQQELELLKFKHHLLSIRYRLGLPMDAKIEEDGSITYSAETEENV